MGADTVKISSLARQVMGIARDDILMHLRFFDRALAGLPCRERPGLEGFATDGSFCFYDPLDTLKRYRADTRSVSRACLHMMLHCVFFHNYQYDKMDAARWDLAADIAVENVILEMQPGGMELRQDASARKTLELLKNRAGALTAERLYRYLGENLSAGQEEELRMLFTRDRHFLWKSAEGLEMTQEQWKKISQRVKTQLKSFAEAKRGTESLEENLEEAVREKYDYAQMLGRFAVTGEELKVSQEEFDLIYYTYGLEHYGNLPLIEPLEYRESRKVREFAIVIDTSASCRGETVKTFLRKTYSILKARENFFHKMNVHIIQCDHQVQEDTKLTCAEDLEAFLRRGKLRGFGGTDFRPAFSYVESLRARRGFENLKGLIYFTDGYGIYPERMPDYQVIFVFPREDGNMPPVPPWGIKAVLDMEM